MVKLLFILCGLFSSPLLFSQENRLNEYLLALMAPETLASKETIARTSFNLTNDYTIYTFGNPDGQYFDTDIPGVKGYKARIVCSVKDGGQDLISDTFLVVMYYDHIKSLWRVFDFRTSADPCFEASVSQDDINKNKFYTDKEYVYRNLGYWCMMCGSIDRASEAYRLASVEAEAKGIKNFVNDHLQTIRSIR